MKKIEKSILSILILVFFCYIDCYSQSVEKPQDNVYFFLYVDKIPEFDGGRAGLQNFLRKTLKWPANELDVQGTVLTSFTITKEGYVENAKIEKSLAKEFDNEAIKLLNQMPKWKAGKLNGKKVNVKLYFPINFHLK